MTGMLTIVILSLIALTFPLSLKDQCEKNGQRVEEITQNLSAIDSLGISYVKYLQTNPGDTLGNPLKTRGLSPQEFCTRIGIKMPKASIMQKNRKVFWGVTLIPDDESKSKYFIAIITPNDSGNLPEAIITIGENSLFRKASYIITLPNNKSVSFNATP